jgi:N-acetylglucosamine-6-phosphate deacetylase
MTNTLAQYGVLGTTPTTVVNSTNDFRQIRQLAESVDNFSSNSKIFGLHLEGPFVNPIKKGGIPNSSVVPYDRDLLLKIINILGDNLKMMTIAPEISPNMEIIDILLDHNIVPALGHSNIDYESAHIAFDKGVKHVTHMFNAMPPLHHRNPGPILAIFERKDVSVQIISDGIHLNPAIVRYLYKTLGINNCICVSDGQSVIGLPDGEYDINGGRYVKNGDRATDIDGNLIGTALDVGAIAKKFQQYTGCSQIEAIQTVTINPAGIVARDNIYDLTAGCMVNHLIAMDDDWNIFHIL